MDEECYELAFSRWHTESTGFAYFLEPNKCGGMNIYMVTTKNNASVEVMYPQSQRGSFA